MRRAISKRHADTTLIMIAQRISSVMGMDHVLVMDEGRVIGYGTHEELIAGCQPYQEIWELQIGSAISGEVQHAG